jgi:DnaJ family protein A protein 5
MPCCYCCLQESEEEVEEHYCVVCEKRFRSAGQLANHERSKKHLEAVAELRQLLQEEEQDADWLVRHHREAGWGMQMR